MRTSTTTILLTLLVKVLLDQRLSVSWILKIMWIASSWLSLLVGDADTLAAIAGPMAYAYYKKMPSALVAQAMKKLPDWMIDVSYRFDDVVNRIVL